MALAQVVEAAVGALGLAFSGEHAGRQFVGSLEREHAGRVGEVARSVFLRDEFEQLTVVLGFGQSDPWNVRVCQRFGGGLDLERLATHMIGVLPRGVLFSELAEARERRFGFFKGLHDLVNLGSQVLRCILGPTFFGMAGSGFEVLAQAQLLGDLGVRGVVIADLSSDFGEVVYTLGWNHALAFAHRIDGLAGLKANQSSDLLPQAVNTAVSELAGDGGDDGEFFVGDVEHVPVAAHLLTDGSQGIFTTALFIFIKNNNIGNIEHFNLLELGVRTKLGGHDVQ